MIVTANARLAISVKATKNSVTGAVEVKSIVLPIDFNDILNVDVFGHQFMDIVHYGTKSTHIKEKPIVDLALKRMREKYNYPLTFGVKIQKNIPTGHGLGSGASNAMATIKAVNRLAKLNLKEDELLEMAKFIGQDMPFFAVNKPSFYEPDAQRITPLKLKIKPYVLLLINKKIIERDEMFAYFLDYGEEKATAIEPVVNAIQEKSLREIGSVLFNDFSDIILKKTPELQYVLHDLRNLGVEAYGLAGTGTTVFALSDNKNLLKYISDKYKKSNYEVVITKIIQ